MDLDIEEMHEIKHDNYYVSDLFLHHIFDVQ
jgi:hypothetical protein